MLIEYRSGSSHFRKQRKLKNMTPTQFVKPIHKTATAEFITSFIV